VYISTKPLKEWSRDAGDEVSIYVDRDGNLFEHIQKYLRNLVLPVFFDDKKGHDEKLYLALLAEARFYGVDRLKRWLEQKVYLRAVKVEVTRRVRDHAAGEDGIINLDDTERFQDGFGADLQETTQNITCKVWNCPRGRHRGDKQTCIFMCGRGGHDADEPALRFTTVSKMTVIDHELCLRWDLK